MHAIGGDISSSSGVQTQRSVTAHNASSSHIGGVIEGLLASSRESTRGVTNALLDRVSAISSKSPAELSSLAGNAAAAAWQAAAVATAPAAAAAAGRISDRHTAPRAGVPNRGGREGMPSVQEAKQPPSWLGTFMTGTAAACSAAFTVVSEATKPGQALSAVHQECVCHMHARSSPCPATASTVPSCRASRYPHCRASRCLRNESAATGPICRQPACFECCSSDHTRPPERRASFRWDMHACYIRGCDTRECVLQLRTGAPERRRQARTAALTPPQREP